MGAVLSTVASNPCSVLSPIPSATPLYYADVRLMLWEWLDALIGRDVLSEKLVEAAVMGSLPSQPRARWRIGTSFEALRRGGLGEAESRHLIRGCAARASSKSENWPRPRRCFLALIFTRAKQFFRFSLRVPLFMVSDSSPRASDGVRALSLRFCRDLARSSSRQDCVLYSWFQWVRASAPTGCSPRGPGGVDLLL